MLSVAELGDILSRRTYKPGWVLSVHEGQTTRAPIVRIYAEAVDDSWNPGQSVPLDIFAEVPTPARESELAFDKWLVWRLGRIEVHEAQEWFRRPGQAYPWVPVFNPHRDGSDRDVWPVVAREEFVPPPPRDATDR